MPDSIRKILGVVVWYGGLNQGVQAIWYALTAGTAIAVAAFSLLLETTSTVFATALFAGLFLIVFALLNHLAGRVMARSRGQDSATTPPASTAPQEARSEFSGGTEQSPVHQGRPSAAFRIDESSDVVFDNVDVVGGGGFADITRSKNVNTTNSRYFAPGREYEARSGRESDEEAIRRQAREHFQERDEK